LYKGDKETDTTTKDFVENDEYKPKLIPNPDMDSLEIAPPPAEYQLPQDESALVDPTQQSSAAIVDPEEKGKQNKFVDFFRNIFGKDDYFSSLGVSKKTARMLRDENNF